VEIATTKEATSMILCQEEHTAVERMAQDFLQEGYAQSKFVAEEMCIIAREQRGLPISIMRPGNMSVNSVTGKQNPNDFVYLFLQGCILLGLAPLEHYAFDLTPVDFAARVVVNAVYNNPTKVIISEYLKASEYFLEKTQIKYLNAILDKISNNIR
jgi:thioester reductase-like protein